MIKRTLEKRLKTAAIQFPVVTVTGPRQSGKTTLVRANFDRYRHISMELPDPPGFLGQVEHLTNTARTIALDFFDNLKYYQGLTGDESTPAALVYGGNDAFRRSGVAVYPWFFL